VEASVKKVAIGCLVLVIVLAVGATVALQVISDRVGSTVKGFSELATVPDLERSIRKQEIYKPPASGALTGSQVQRLLQVQQAVRARLGARAAELEREYHTLLQKDSATITDAPELLRAYRDIAVGYVDAKRAQVDALNKAGFSLGEYRWVRTQAYGALGIPLVEVDMAEIIGDIQSGRTPPEPSRVTTPLEPTGSPASRQLVAPHRKVLEDNAALAAFGL
jgi:hypothetical protein